MGNEHSELSHGDTLTEVDNISSYTNIESFNLAHCFSNIHSTEKHLIKDISLNLATCLLENFRSLVYVFSYLNSAEGINQDKVEKLRATSELTMWLSEMNRKCTQLRA